jgi:hypothetical protein
VPPLSWARPRGHERRRRFGRGHEADERRRHRGAWPAMIFVYVLVLLCDEFLDLCTWFDLLLSSSLDLILSSSGRH